MHGIIRLIPPLRRVPKAIPGRDAMEIEIFGMAGVPAGLKPGAGASFGGGTLCHSAVIMCCDLQ